MTQQPLREPFHTILYRIVEKQSVEKRLNKKELAEHMGVSYRTFMYWLHGRSAIPPEKLPELCTRFGDYQLLDVLEQQAGRVAYLLPHAEGLTSMEDAQAVQKLIKEVGEALQALAETLQDGIVTQEELETTIPELDDVIRECIRLKHWLEERSRSIRKNPTKSSS